MISPLLGVVDAAQPAVEEYIAGLFATGFLPEPHQLINQTDSHAELANAMVNVFAVT